MRVLLTDIRIALTSLRSTRIRTGLTMLGIIIGVACITTVIALGEGAKGAIGSQITQLGGNVLTIRPGKADRDQAGNITNYNLLASIGATTITERDYNTVKSLPGIKNAAPFMLVTGSVKSGDRTAKNAQIIASNTNLQPVLNLQMGDGEFLNETIDRNTVVIGSDLADEMYDTQQVLGRKLSLRKQDFTVVGVLKKNNSPTNLSGFDLNRAAYVRLDAGKGFNQGIAQIQQIMVQAPDADKDINALSGNIFNKLLENHGGEEDFAVLKPADTKRIADSTFAILTAVTSAIASISIIVGGVGIMNIMLVSVTERTREIGIRKSVGASDRQVLRQFLIEALVMSVGGGVIGIAVAYAVAFLIAIQFGFIPALSIPIIALALGVSIGTGIVFGSYPALKAARKDPIDALRQYQ
jgi:putative ABC transport system permease protein